MGRRRRRALQPRCAPETHDPSSLQVSFQSFIFAYLADQLLNLECSGTITDLEAMGLEEKLEVLRNEKWKCTVRGALHSWGGADADVGPLTLVVLQVKRELLKEHQRTWKKNGLRGLAYEFADAVSISDHCTKITVDLGPNGHWSDARSSLERTPVSAPVEQQDSEKATGQSAVKTPVEAVSEGANQRS